MLPVKRAPVPSSTRCNTLKTSKTTLANWAVGYSLVVLATKSVMMLLSGSMTVISETMDVITDLALLFVLKYVQKKSSEPADKDHMYGHGKYEPVGAVVQSIIITVIYTLIIYNAIHQIINNEVPEIGQGIITILMFSVLTASNLVIGFFFIVQARHIGNNNIRIQGINYFFDGLRSVLVIFAIGLYILGFPLADPLFAIAVSVIVVVSTFASCRGSFRNLLEENPLTGEEMLVLYNTVQAVEDIYSVQNLRVKLVGETLYITMEIAMDGEKTLKEAHDKTEEIETVVAALFPERTVDVLIHVHA